MNDTAEGRVKVMWQAFTKDMIPAKATKAHFMRGDPKSARTTLCGLVIPFNAEDGSHAFETCVRCERLAERAARPTPFRSLEPNPL